MWNKMGGFMKNKYEVRGDKVAIFLKHMDMEQSITIINKDDLEKAKSIKGRWCARLDKKNNSPYVVHMGPLREGKRETFRLHRLIMNCPEGMVVDHINHDTLDNTKENLRVVTYAENCQNISMRKSNKSGYRGVSWSKDTNKWRVTARINGKIEHFGLYEDVEQAGQIANQVRTYYMPGYINQSN